MIQVFSVELHTSPLFVARLNQAEWQRKGGKSKLLGEGAREGLTSLARLPKTNKIGGRMLDPF